MQIYNHFAELPPLAYDMSPNRDMLDGPNKERFDIATTRISLLSVSRQITAEWAPIFWKTTTVLVSPTSESPLDVYSEGEEFDGDYFPSSDFRRKRTPAEFESLFISQMAELKLQSIWKLEFDATVDIASGSSGNFIDYDGLAKLSRSVDKTGTTT